MGNKWAGIKYFKPHEFDDPNHPGSGDLINEMTLTRIDLLRMNSKCRIIIHTNKGGAVDIDGAHGHSKDSHHLEARGFTALDWHFELDPKYPEGQQLIDNPRLQYGAVERAGFRGIGVYYDWGIPVGFHTDMRRLDRCQRWTRKEGEYFYLLR